MRNFVALLGRAEVARLVRAGRPAVACIGPVTAGTAREHGLPVTVMPREYTAGALAGALVEHFCVEGDPDLSDPATPEGTQNPGAGSGGRSARLRE